MSPCVNVGTAVIACGPPSGVYTRTTIHCDECGDGVQERRGIERWDGAWYGTTLYCECGDKWQEGWRFPRPFERYWRRDAQHRFEAMWLHAAPKEMYERYIRADVVMAVGDDSEAEAASRRRQAAHEEILAHADKVTPR